MKSLLPEDFDINELDVSEIAQWPRLIQLFVIAVFSLLMMLIMYQYSLKEKMLLIEQLEKGQVELKDGFEKKIADAKNYKAYLLQKKEVEVRLNEVLGLLPSKAQVPGLVDAVSEQGVSSGLTFRSIRMRPEKQDEFLVELPMEINVVGAYHEFGDFVGLMAGLPRLVTLHDFSIMQLTDSEREHVHYDSGSETLRMILTAKTYRHAAGEIK